MSSSLLSKLTVSTIGLASKALLNLGYCGSVTVHGLQNLVDALHSNERSNGRGIITMSNHISTLDDPVVWGILPTSYFWQSRTTRWVLGASDIMFTNPVFSLFFRHGQVLETFRGNGVFQPAVDSAIEKLNKGDWIHLFGEGKVNQPEKLDPREGETAIPVSQHHANLLRFKWGVGRILMEVEKPPIIIPMWLTGFDELMPEGRPFPYKFLPRRGVHLTVTFGKPISEYTIKDHLQSTAPTLPLETLPIFDEKLEAASKAKYERGWLGDAEPQPLRAEAKEVTYEIERTRSIVTALIQREVEALGKDVAERTLK